MPRLRKWWKGLPPNDRPQAPQPSPERDAAIVRAALEAAKGVLQPWSTRIEQVERIRALSTPEGGEKILKTVEGGK